MRRRIIALAIVVATLALTVLAVPLALDTRSRIRADERSELARLAAITAADISAEAAAGTDPLELSRPADSATRLAVYSAAGRRQVGRGPDRLDAALGPVKPGTVREAVTGSELIVAVPISVDERLTAVVRASEAMGTLDGRVRRSWLRIGVAALAALVVATAIAVGLAHRLLRPLLRLRDAAERIGTGDVAAPHPSGLAEIDSIAAVLTASSARVEASLTRERAFSADVSHQLRTPLTGLRLTLENELEQPRSDPHEALSEALSDVDHLEATIEGLLALARDTMDRRSLIDLCDPLKARAATWQAKFQADGRQLVLMGTTAAILVRASASAISEILDVLVGNARAHACGTVTVEVERRLAVAAIRVSDQGPGLADPSTLFRRRHVDAKGNGIGLALARRLAEAEGGTLTLTNYLGHCTFELLLPG